VIFFGAPLYFAAELSSSAYTLNSPRSVLAGFYKKPSLSTLASVRERYPDIAVLARSHSIDEGSAWRKNKKSLTLYPWIAEIYTHLRWDSPPAHLNLDEAERLLQRALTLYPAPRDRYLVILVSPGCARESPNRSLLPWTRRFAHPIDGAWCACRALSALSEGI
jgi:hypothetical protein